MRLAGRDLDIGSREREIAEGLRVWREGPERAAEKEDFDGDFFGVLDGDDRGVLLPVYELDAEDFGVGEGRVYGDVGERVCESRVLVGERVLVIEFVGAGLLRR